MAEHVAGDIVNAADASCIAEGYTGDIPCAVCGEIITAGEVIAMLPHAAEAHACAEKLSDICPDCGCILPPVHAFDSNTCTDCGWMIPGLYVNDDLITAWADLVSSGAIRIEGALLISIDGDMQMGKLVISEEITSIDALVCDTLSEVWIPVNVIGWNDALLGDSAGIKTIRLFCEQPDLNAIGDEGEPVELQQP